MHSPAFQIMTDSESEMEKTGAYPYVRGWEFQTFSWPIMSYSSGSDFL